MLVEMGSFAYANNLLQKIADDDHIKDKSKINCYLGLSSYSQGEYCGASKYLFCAVNMGGFYSGEALNWLKLLHIISGFEPTFIYQSDSLHFNFIDAFTEDERKWFIEKYTSSYDRIQSFFSAALPKPIDVFIYKDHRDEIGNNLSYSNAPLSTIHVFWKEDCGHELTHVISNHVNGGVKNKCAFVQEGVAECFNLNTYFCFKDDISPATSIDDLWNHFDGFNQRFAHRVAKRFFLLLLNRGGRDNLLRLIKDQRIENARKIYGPLFFEIKDCVEQEICAGSV